MEKVMAARDSRNYDVLIEAFEEALPDAYGKSVLGSTKAGDVMLFRRKWRKGKPRILMMSGQHGEELAGPWALLKLVENNSDLLDKADVSFVPVCNVYGFVNATRNGETDAKTNWLTTGDGRTRENLGPEVKILSDNLKELADCAKDGLLNMHEDITSEGFYVYVFGDKDSDTVKDILRAGREHFDFKRNGTYHDNGDYELQDGIVDNHRDGTVDNAIVERYGIPISVTTETPAKGSIDIEDRIEASAAMAAVFVRGICRGRRAYHYKKVERTEPGSKNEWKVTYSTGNKKWTNDRPGDGKGDSTGIAGKRMMKAPAVKRSADAIVRAKNSDELKEAVNDLYMHVGLEKSVAVIRLLKDDGRIGEDKAKEASDMVKARRKGASKGGNGKVALELCRIARGLLAMVTVQEVGGELVVRGPYVEMKDVYPELKRMGFRYVGLDKSWRIPLSKLSNDKRKKVDELVGGGEKKREDALRSVEDELGKLFGSRTFDNFKVMLGQGGLDVSGDTYSIKDDLYRLGGRWNGKGYLFALAQMSEDVPSRLFKLIDEFDEKLSKSLKMRRDFYKSKIEGRKWAAGMISANLHNDVLYVYVASKDMNSVVKDAFERPKWVGGAWEISLKSTNTNEMKKFVELAEEEEKKLGVTPSGPGISWSMGSGYVRYRDQPYGEGDVVVPPEIVRNKHGVEFVKILKVASRYFKEDGLSFGVGDDSGYVWTFFARPATDAESEPLRLEIEKRKGKAKALVELKQIADEISSKGNYPSPWVEPQGDVIYLQSEGIIYGGGSWFVVGMAGIWFVKNNGADGDDWSHNNVRTGGAGAIGKVVRHDAELADRIWLLADVAGLKKE